MLFDALYKYSLQNICSMHMPGHKRNIELLGNNFPYNIDITEVDGFDNLHMMNGILKDAADNVSALYGSKESFLLVNGSTGGLLAAIRSAVKRGEKIIMARNCHKSVYNAVELNCLKTVYLVPETDEETGVNGSITAEQVCRALDENPDARLVVITSPTYEGVISDIDAIAEVAHQKNVPVLVDEAHGAHLGFSEYFPGGALKSGADIVVNSIHKTLPALTQCALLHIGGDLIDGDRIARELAVFETSSPSYILLASIDSCVRMLTEKKNELFGDYESNLRLFDESIIGLKKLKVLCHGRDNLINHSKFFSFDPGKIVISTANTNLSGVILADILRKQYLIEPEMAYANYAIAMTSICDTAESFGRLAAALIAIDQTVEQCPKPEIKEYSYPLPKQEKPIFQAIEEEGEFLSFEQSVGAMSLEYVWAYPPGIPLITPGEIIDCDLMTVVNELAISGVNLNSTRGQLPQYIYAKRL